MIDERLGTYKGESLSAGSCWHDGLGFSNKPLFLTPSFWQLFRRNRTDENSVEVKLGYSKDHRPDLKQVSRIKFVFQKTLSSNVRNDGESRWRYP